MKSTNYMLFSRVLSLLICLCVFSLPVQTVLAKQTEQFYQRLLRYDVIIDIGHGGIDGGTSYGNLLEKDLNLSIGIKLYQKLQERGYQVGVTRIHDYALSDDNYNPAIRSRHRRDLAQRWLIAQELHPKLYLSIHINYSSSSSAQGPLVIHQRQGESYLFAQLLQQYLNQLARVNKSSYPSSNYYLLKAIQSPSLIAEVGFISHPAERQKLQDPKYQEQLAATISQAIEHYFTLYPSARY